jgi:deoxyhypusine synthase
MMLTLGGAMSTAEIGISLAEMIRQNKVHGVSCTGANLEEDIFNLVAYSKYQRVLDYRTFGSKEETRLHRAGFNRVTDTCIPNDVLWDRLEKPFLEQWQMAERSAKRLFPHEFVYRILRDKRLERYYGSRRRTSWVYAAMEKKLPLFVPGWEDSALGNMYAAACVRGDIKKVDTVRSGIEAMIELIQWYRVTSSDHSMGFFQIGGGIAGDFPICVVPLLHEDLLESEIPRWAYFCQISDSTTSYGSYSGAVPTEKISWGKLDAATASYIIESDATIVAPLIFAVVLGW